MLHSAVHVISDIASLNFKTSERKEIWIFVWLFALGKIREVFQAKPGIFFKLCFWLEFAILKFDC